MENDILLALIKGEPVSQSLLENALYEMCDQEHACCNSACLVYSLNGDAAVNAHRPFEENRGCDCFKNGHAMFAFIKTHLTIV